MLMHKVWLQAVCNLGLVKAAEGCETAAMTFTPGRPKLT